MSTNGTDKIQLLDSEELGAWRGMLRVHAELTKALDAELTEVHGLPLSSYEVLLFLAGEPEGRMRMSELADSVLLSRSGLTRLVDRLERGGLLERVQCDEDARGYFAQITPAGREAFNEARRTHLEGVRRLFLSRFSREELRELGGLWERVLVGSAASP
jgi:DNA-binding MarR family transcriptional regulator